MTARDELAEAIRLELRKGSYQMPGDMLPYETQASAIADAILAAGYRKPRTITTEAELDALPVGSVIRTSGLEFQFEPRVAIKDGVWKGESEWVVADTSEWCLSSDELDDLPATVLYEGAQS